MTTFYNKPHLRIRRRPGRRFGCAVFHPGSGMCPWQARRFVAKVMRNACYGKFGAPAVVEPGEESAITGDDGVERRFQNYKVTILSSD